MEVDELSKEKKDSHTKISDKAYSIAFDWIFLDISILLDDFRII